MTGSRLLRTSVADLQGDGLWTPLRVEVEWADRGQPEGFQGAEQLRTRFGRVAKAVDAGTMLEGDYYGARSNAVRRDQ